MVVLEARLGLQVEVSVEVVGRGFLAQDLLLRSLQNDRNLLLREQVLLLELLLSGQNHILILEVSNSCNNGRNNTRLLILL